MNKFKILFAMSLKPPSILHCVDSIAVLAGRFFVLVVRYLLQLLKHWGYVKFLSMIISDFFRNDKRAAVSQKCFTAITGTKHGTHVINALP